MIIYRSDETVCQTQARLAELQEQLQVFQHPHFLAYDQCVDFLIDYGELETGIADFCCAKVDRYRSVLGILREGAVAAAHVFLNVWHQDHRTSPRHIHALETVFRRLRYLKLPETFVSRVFEGLAYSGLFPHLYAQAATDFVLSHKPKDAVCIGIRSIGTVLSAIVAATLEDCGCETDTYTLRPRGHPYDRAIAVSDDLESRLKARIAGHFVIVDEGPGRSGSSFTSVIRKLRALGVPRSRIILFPSRNPAGEQLISAEARELWDEQEKYISPLQKEILQVSRDNNVVKDYSAGNWRTDLFGESTEIPPVQPDHERIKLITRDGTCLKFEGFGKYGKARRARAETLAESGFVPAPLRLEKGFLISDFVPGKPLREWQGAALLQRIPRYLNCLQQKFPAREGTAFDEFHQMIRVNAGECFGGEVMGAIDQLELCRIDFQDMQPLAIDGRMLPHEWIRTKWGYLKTDALDHHDDRFFPGCTGIEWDLACVLTEFNWTTPQADHLTSVISPRNGQLLRFFKIAYLSFRLGYCRMQQDIGTHAEEAIRFQKLERKYSRLLKSELQPAMQPTFIACTGAAIPSILHS